MCNSDDIGFIVDARSHNNGVAGARGQVGCIDGLITLTFRAHIDCSARPHTMSPLTGNEQGNQATATHQPRSGVEWRKCMRGKEEDVRTLASEVIARKSKQLNKPNKPPQEEVLLFVMVVVTYSEWMTYCCCCCGRRLDLKVLGCVGGCGQVGCWVFSEEGKKN